MHGRRGRGTEREELVAAIRAIPLGKERLRDASVDGLVLATGLPRIEIAALLPSLADEYGARVAATAVGSVLWRFPAGMESRSRRSTLKRLATACARKARRLAELLLEIGYSFWALAAYILFRSRETEFAPSLHGRAYGFYDLLLSFTFGDPDPEQDWAELRRRRFLGWAATKDGLVSAAEYALYWGTSLAEAEETMASFAAEWDGEPRALGAGILAWYFPKAVRAGGAAPGTAASPVTRVAAPPKAAGYWRRMRSFSGNPPAGNLAIALASAVNLVFGTATLHAVDAWWALDAVGRDDHILLSALVTFFGLAGPGLVAAFLGFLPLVAGLLGLTLPLLRRFRVRRDNKLRNTDNDRMTAGRRVLEEDGFVLLEHLPERVGRNLGRSRREASRGALRRALDRLAAEFGAEIEGEAGGRLAYRFPALQAELAALEAARRELGPAETGNEEEGRIVFDSGEAISRD